MNPYRALAVIAAVSVASSLLIVVFALHTLNRITDAGMFGIGLMAFAPAVLGVGVSYFLVRLAENDRVKS
jgi:hypothetical protein